MRVCSVIIDVLLPDPPTKFARYVMSHGTKLHNGNPYSIRMARMGREVGRMIPSKSYEHGAYPPNVIGEKHIE